MGQHFWKKKSLFRHEPRESLSKALLIQILYLEIDLLWSTWTRSTSFWWEKLLPSESSSNIKLSTVFWCPPLTTPGKRFLLGKREMIDWAPPVLLVCACVLGWMLSDGQAVLSLSIDVKAMQKRSVDSVARLRSECQCVASRNRHKRKREEKKLSIDLWCATLS